MSGDSTSSEFLSEISSWLKSFPTSCDQHSASRNLKQLQENIHEKQKVHKDFLSFMMKDITEKTQPGSYGTNMYWKMLLPTFHYVWLFKPVIGIYV